MAWSGRRVPDDPARDVLFEGTDETVSRLLEIFDRYEVPITWAAVGALMLTGPYDFRRFAEFNGADPFFTGGWYDAPAFDSPRAKYFYAPCLIEKILNAKTKHEIACHTFTHVYLGAGSVSEKRFRAELEACAEAAAAWNLNLETFVYPSQYVGYAGIRIPGLPAGIARMVPVRQTVYPEFRRSVSGLAPKDRDGARQVDGRAVLFPARLFYAAAPRRRADQDHDVDLLPRLFRDFEIRDRGAEGAPAQQGGRPRGRRGGRLHVFVSSLAAEPPPGRTSRRSRSDLRPRRPAPRDEGPENRRGAGARRAGIRKLNRA